VETITGFFLRAKHWQIFALVWGTYIAGQIASIELLSTGGLLLSVKTALLTAVFFAPSLLISCLWFWSLGSFLIPVSESKASRDIRFFRFSLIFSALTLVTVSPFLVSRNLFLQLLVVPLHLFGMFCLLHALYSVSKSLLVAEKRQVATFGDCAPTFVLLIASIVGVWFIQPRVNRLYAQR
jgi:hypothetical protein